MSFLFDTCFRCKSSLKTPYTCDTCNKSFHRSCACNYIKSRTKDDCCRQKFDYLLSSILVNKINLVNKDNTKSKTIKIRLNSLRSVTSNNSSNSSFKSAQSTDRPSQNSRSKQKSGVISPVSPQCSESSVSDSVFLPDSGKLSMATMHSNSVEVNATMVSASTSTAIVNALPSNWSSLSADDKLTLVMKSVAQIPSLTTEFKLLSSKIDDFNKRLNSIQEEQSATKVKLASINTNVLANTDKISKMVTALEELREDTNLNTRKAKTLADQMASLKSSCSVNQDVSTSSTNTRVSSELIITGIPDCVTESLSSLEIASGVFEVLNISNLITDILTIRKIDKKQKTNSIDNNSNIENVKGRPKLHSFILQMKSQQVRDHIIDSRKKLRNLFIKNVFPQITGDSYQGNIYINEFLNVDTHKLLLNTKHKAKNLHFKYVWVQNGSIYVKKDKNSLKIKICSDLDLDNLE
ncbi:uncharacterized protein LOC141535623 [Cotesia typhae]|uniref:uncharacterized protein LOC141535623 n=1 Tax=Cotesia typhae TaxID=2053667 RepID=UPI003D6843C6